MQGENIICFAKDWSGDPTSVTHVMKHLARGNRVLWLNSIATRTPNLSSRGDLSKIVQKFKGFFKGAEQVQENLWVYTPIILPFPYNRVAARINRLILKTAIKGLRRKLGMREFQLWAWPPTAGEYVGTLGESIAIYYCTDAWSSFSTVNGVQMREMETRLVCQADIVFATSVSLTTEKHRLNPETYHAAHGVAHAMFARALDEDVPLPGDLADCTGPVIGFYGLIEDWMDQDLIVYLAVKHPEWVIALVGKVCIDVSRFDSYPNIRILGRKPHADLPAYCKAFSVGVLPHKVNELTRHMNPIKLREYLSAGLPVVSTALPEVAAYGEFCAVTNTYDEFERAIQNAISSDSTAEKRRRSQTMAAETWDVKIKLITDRVLDVMAAKQAHRSLSA